MRSDEEIRADLGVACPCNYPDNAYGRLAADAGPLLARAVAAETENEQLREVLTTSLRVENGWHERAVAAEAAVAAALEAVTHGSYAEAVAALAGAAPEGDPAPQVEVTQLAAELMTLARTWLADGSALEADQLLAVLAKRMPLPPHADAAPVAAVVQATPEQDTQR
jgi:hypothetical protein